VKLGYIDLTEVLLEKGANPNIRVHEEGSPLFISLQNEYFDIAQQMITSGAEVDIRNK
jgi:ankyrin repeat protein